MLLPAGAVLVGAVIALLIERPSYQVEARRQRSEARAAMREG